MGRANKTTVSVVDTSSQEELKRGAAKIPRLNERLTPELVIALVGPVGSGCTTTYEILKETLETDFAYSVSYYKLSEYIVREAKLVDQTIVGNLAAADRVSRLQDVGDKLRQVCGNTYLAAKAIYDIAAKREKEGFGRTKDNLLVPKKLRYVHIIDSLKHPEELKLLRETYGEIFWLIGVFAPLSIRERRLTSQKHLQKGELNAIFHRDYKEEAEHGQRVRDVFHQADFFVRNDKENTAQLSNLISRYLEVVFGKPVHTPTLDESSMYAAYAEASKSACLSRQVGAAILSKEGELIGLGRNDVPQFGGGAYTEDSKEADHRCHAWQEKVCHNDKHKNLLYRQIFERLKHEEMLSDQADEAAVTKVLKATEVKQLIEFSRSVHAEMDAIISVARTLKAGLLGGTLYTTTYPCHSCARHIVTSGIHKVLFIEPYPKSLATDLHSDAVSEDEGEVNKKVLFLQFSGFAPKNILKLFNAGLTRKDANGKLEKFDKRTAAPVVKVSLDDYPTHEKLVIAELTENEEAAQRKQSVIPGT